MGESRRLWVLPLVVTLAVALFGAALLWAVIEVDHRADRNAAVAATNAEAAQQNADTAEQLASDVNALREQVKGTGEEPVAPPAEDTVEDLPRPPIPGPPGPPPSRAQVEAAVRAYLIANPPQRGRPPTEAEIRSAVAAFCDARNDCVGPAGSDGEDGADSTVPGPPGPAGSDGADSTVPGPRGEPGSGPTDAQVAAAVAAFCADGNCRGADGTDGTDGRGIVSVRLESSEPRDCFLVFEFTAEPLEERIEINPLVCLGK